MSNGIPNIRIPYRPELYVERESALEKATEWLTRQKKRRLLTITGPPATGKTWFLNRMREAFGDNSTVVTEWIDVYNLLPSSNGQPAGNGEISPERKSKWLEALVDRLSHRCDNVSQFDPAVDTAVLIEMIAREICRECWSGKMVCLIIDGGDQFSDIGWRQFERTILEPFAREPLLRFVIALRDEQRVQSVPLRWSEKRLNLGALAGTDPLSGTEKGHEQLRELVKNSPDDSPDVEQILATLPAYNWTHPGLNTFIYLYVKTNAVTDQPAPLDSAHLKIGLNALTRLPEDNGREIIEWLLEIAALDDEWVIEDLETAFGVSRSEAWNQVQSLQDHWLVTNVKSNRFKITGGVLEFVRATQVHQAANQLATTS